MARKKKRTVKNSTTKCKFCLKSFSNLGLHFFNNPLCAEFNLNNDLTLVTTDQHISSTLNTSNNRHSTTTYDFFHSNDVHSHLFEQNDNQESISSSTSNPNINNDVISLSVNNSTTNVQQQLTENETNTILSSNSTNQSFDNESINSNVIIESAELHNSDYLATCSQIDSMIEIINPDKKIQSTDCNQHLSQSIPCLYNFTNFRIEVLKNKWFILPLIMV